MESMKRVFFIALTCYATVSFGQKYQFDYLGTEKDDFLEETAEHYLGDDIGYKLLLLKDSYTFTTYDEISRTETSTVEKPTIYFSIKKVDKHYKKQFKKGVLEKEEAVKHMDSLLTVALNIKNQDTDELESDLRGIKDPSDIIAFFESEIEFKM